MKKLSFTLIFIAIYAFANGQSTKQSAYFQQEVNYKINVTLDDEKHFLNGNIEIEYTNNAPDELTEIYFHLWPNAYKNTETEFAKQQYENGSTRFLFSKIADRGYIDNLDFSENGQVLEWKYDEKHIDIALVQLKTPLKNGETITIKTPFQVKIPASFSRLGHVRTSYQMAQWFPKPAVYDRDGWHQMPYLNQGEFYSEYGSFDVSITLPKNYVVGATGSLQTESEVAFLKEKVEMTDAAIKDSSYLKKQDYPESASEMKTIRYTAENVHDFAWFADKRFYVRKGDVELASGKKVDTWVMFTYKEANLWKDGIKYLNRSVKYYSDRIGEYPYPHATAVQSALSAGAGMEYPMITVIGLSGNAKSLDIVITHEVGHNWFYGILGSNERQHVWMDEGFNSYYEEAYTYEYYETKNTVGDFVPSIGGLISKDELKQDLGYAAYRIQESRGEFIAPSNDARKMTSMNYGILGYFYPAYLFRYAEAYLGLEKYNATMQTYYEEWKFKHPQPNDTKNIFERETGKEFDWLFNDLFGSKKKLDYALTSAKTGDKGVILKITNVGEIAAPFSISGLKDGAILETVWYDGHSGSKDIPFPNTYQGYRIDAINVMPESNRYNNYIKANGVFKKSEKLQLKFLGGLESGERNKLYFTPTLGANAHDGFMLGVAFYNGFFPQKKFEYTIMPMYGFNSGKLVGTADANFYMFPKSDKFRHVKVGANVKSFSKLDNSDPNYTERYLKITPHVELKFKPTATSTQSQYLRARGAYIQEEEASWDISGFTGIGTSNRAFYELSYELSNKQKLYPYKIKANLLSNHYTKGTSNESDIRLTVEGNYKFNYFRKINKAARLRVFAGQFLTNTQKDFGVFPMAITGQNNTDYFYDDWFFGRGSRTGFGTQQIDGTQGGFKTPLPAAFRGIGKSNSTLLALNLTLDAPMDFLPISAFIDMAYFEDTRPSVNTFKTLASGGLKLSLFRNYVNIYLPLFGTDELMNAYREDRNLFERVSFSIKLKGSNPIELIRESF